MDATRGWTGTERTWEQIDEIRKSFDGLVDEVGGKVRIV
jgi:hypothetical protein